MRRTVLILAVFTLTLTIYSCSVDEINTPQTKSMEVPVGSEPIQPVTKVNARVFTKAIADTLLPNKNNRALMMEMEGSGDTGTDIPIQKSRALMMEMEGPGDQNVDFPTNPRK